jgi:hypothetical protein
MVMYLGAIIKGTEVCGIEYNLSPEGVQESVATPRHAWVHTT